MATDQGIGAVKFAEFLGEEADHTVGDKERFRKVADRYKDLLSRIKELNGMTGFKERNPDLHRTLMAGMKKELEDMKPYFKTYSTFRNTKEDDDMDFVFKEGLMLIKAWFEGWYMSRRTYDKIGPLIRTFKAIQKICPAHDMVLFRVVAVEDARQAQKLKAMQTGPRSLQSWTTTMKAAKRFFNTQYSDGQTMIVDNDGHIEYVDKLAQRDYVVVKAKFAASSIYWTPTTMDDLSRYDMHCVDSKLYPYHRIPDKVSSVLYEYSGQQEVIVNVDGNGEVPVMGVYPIHVRNEMSDEPF